MKRFLLTMLLACVLIVGGWTLYHREQINNFGDFLTLAQQQFVPESWNSGDASLTSLVSFSQDAPSRDTTAPYESAIRLPNRQKESITPPPNIIRLASFKWQSNGRNSSSRRQMLADICARFDVISIQDNDRSGMVAKVVHELNSRGGEFRFIDRRDDDRTFAIIFNQQTLMLDQSHWYSVNDPEHLLENQPLVAWFRARNAPFDQAFTFTLVNLQLNTQRPDRELSYIGQLFRAIRDDGRGEDDIILAGDFACGDRGLKILENPGGLSWAISNQPTNTANDAQYENIVFNQNATMEFTGNSDVYDFLKYLNLTLVDAYNVSEHLPVWCDFSTFEGHTPGRYYQPIDGTQ